MDARSESPSNRSYRSLIEHLAIADPEAARRIAAHLSDSDPSTYLHQLEHAVDEVVEALSVELTFGRKLAEGIAQLLVVTPSVDLSRYLSMVKTASASGPTLAALFAQHLVPVLMCGDRRLADRFQSVTRIMLQKGTYTLKAPLETLSALIQRGEMDCAYAFLDLLATTYSLPTSYNRTVYLTHNMPGAVGKFHKSRRLWQIRGLTRTISEDERLFDKYLNGLASGLHLLSEAALEDFLELAISRYHKDPDAGAKWFALESSEAKTVCEKFQVAVPLSAVQSGLERYLLARTGLAVCIRPFSALEKAHPFQGSRPPMVHSDGRAIYLPDEMDLLERRTENAGIYKLLIKLEAGLFEFGTFNLDLVKALDTAPVTPPSAVTEYHPTESELRRFFKLFDDPQTALDLFTLFEHARLNQRVSRRYPGLSRRLHDALTDNRLLARTGGRTGGTLYPLYRHLVLNNELQANPQLASLFESMAERFEQVTTTGEDTTETSVHLAFEFYPHLVRLASAKTFPGFQPLTLPFGRRFDPSNFGPFHTAYDRLAADIHSHLTRYNVDIYRSDLRDLLVRNNGQASTTEVQQLALKHVSATVDGGPVEESCREIASLIGGYGMDQVESDTDGANAFRYREWNWCMGDYLPNRVRVLEHTLKEAGKNFYQQTLDTFHGLVKHIRYAFELLRPEEMEILRQWPEGDAFDYRALLDYTVDKKAGLMPSDRLFIKRMKGVRDVATLLLVDLSKSTANTIDDQETSVLDVEKQAIVLFCEALKVVGDRFAIAGFSGTGPLGVDYFRIKDLEKPFDDRVKKRISAMTPQRSTRMGAAIRHAIAQIAPVQARVKLIVIISDGYPNDLAYKGPYAVEDTRRAIMEARTANVHVKAITVNINDNGQLDRLYGKSHHTLIGNVRDLPDRLVRVYSALTKH